MDFTQSIDRNIGNNIRTIRHVKGLSQQKLAEKCGIQAPVLSGYETGKRNPSLTTVARIAKSLGVSIDTLCYGDENISFINSEPDDGKKIVNSLKLLWEKNVIHYHPEIQYPSAPNKFGEIQFPLTFARHSSAAVRLFKNLYEFGMNEDTFDNPDAFIEMTLTSVASEINKEIEKAKNGKKALENTRKNLQDL